MEEQCTTYSVPMPRVSRSLYMSLMHENFSLLLEFQPFGGFGNVISLLQACFVCPGKRNGMPCS